MAIKYLLHLANMMLLKPYFPKACRGCYDSPWVATLMGLSQHHIVSPCLHSSLEERHETESSAQQPLLVILLKSITLKIK